MMETKAKMGGRISSLQGLRVLAFIGIFLSHAIDTPSGSWGVSVFIMLSGFVMVYSYWNRWEDKTYSIKEALGFSIRKIKPLYPLHIIMLIAAFIPYYLWPVIQNYSNREMLKIVAKLVITVPLIQTWFPVGFEAINTVAWYLSAMLFLYAVFPYIMRFLKKRQWDIKNIIIMMILAYAAQFGMAFVFRFLPLLKNAHWSCYILPLFRFWDFFIGCCLGYCFLHIEHKKMNRTYATVCEALFFALAFLGMIGIVKLPNASWFTFTLIFVPSSAGIVWFLAWSEGVISKVLSTKLFQIAATITPFAFLIHRQILHYTEDIYAIITKQTINPLMLIIIAMAITVALSYLYMWVTKKRKRMTA